jgi:MYXO-CTERM domain-containing protein
VLNQCDIYLNGANATWSTSGTTASGDLDVETVMLHEAGHCLGLDHFGLGNVMQGDVQAGFQKRGLDQQDIDALCQHNPISGGIGSPCPDGGGCGNTVPGIKCVTQPLPTGSAKFCTVGCQDGTGFQCDVPLYCQAANFFSPTFTGACLRSGNTVTTVGSPCVAGSNCSSSLGVCQADVGPGFFPRWVQGYCTQHCEAGQPNCPAGSACTLTPAAFCLASCRVGLADCRPDYSCALTSNGGVCIPSCHADSDCGDVVNYQCRVCDGLCVARQNVSGQIGDVCSVDTQCGAGQICSAVLPGKPGMLCTLPCGKGCGDCPTGAACHPIAPTNALYCLKTCSGPGTCQAGTRCANLPTGRGCVPPCDNDFDCNVGENCVLGDCINPNEDDAGCGAFCMTGDSGHPIIPPKKDGGSGPGGTGGCGCSTPSDFAALLAAAAVLWAMSRRRVRERAWPRR